MKLEKFQINRKMVKIITNKTKLIKTKIMNKVRNNRITVPSIRISFIGHSYKNLLQSAY